MLSLILSESMRTGHRNCRSIRFLDAKTEEIGTVTCAGVEMAIVVQYQLETMGKLGAQLSFERMDRVET